MKSTFAISALALAASTLAADSKTYTLHATKTDSYGLLDKPIHANGGRFWVNKPSNIYCPPEVEQAAGSCPSTKRNVTAFITESKLTSLDVDVPGGQSVYIARDGVVRFTVPHGNVPPKHARVKDVREVLLGKRTWLCSEKNTTKDYDSSAYFLTVSKNATTLPKVAHDRTCTRIVLRAKHFESQNATAWEYL